MANRKLTPAEQRNARSWLHDVFLAGKLLDESKAKRADGSDRFYNRYSSKPRIVTACEDICNEILNRSFKDIQNSLNYVSNYSFYKDFNNTRTIYKSSSVLASYIAWFCKENGIYWDDTVASTYEIELFEKTDLGQAVKEFGCYISVVTQIKFAKGTTTTGKGTRSGQPKNDYKSTGGQSSNARDLIGTPGVKINVSGTEVYCIEGVNANTTKIPAAYIKPLSTSGAAGNTNKVFIGDPSGYTDCKVFFEDFNNALTFLDNCITGNKIPSNISNLKVVKAKVDKNGYFEIGTEFGPVFIKASKLNEELIEAYKEHTNAKTRAEEMIKKLQEDKKDYIEDSAEFAKNLMIEL